MGGRGGVYAWALVESHDPDTCGGPVLCSRAQRARSVPYTEGGGTRDARREGMTSPIPRGSAAEAAHLHRRRRPASAYGGKQLGGVG
eukprot:scaffold24461_cov67-Isochrysis_galbana.AAC.1